MVERIYFEAGEPKDERKQPPEGPPDIGLPRKDEAQGHMHVARDDLSAKVWLDPDVRVANNHGFSRKELREIERIARQNLELLRHEWDDFCHHGTPAT